MEEMRSLRLEVTREEFEVLNMSVLRCMNMDHTSALSMTRCGVLVFFTDRDVNSDLQVVI